MKKQFLTDKQKKDFKYFTIMTIIIYITFELLKYFNQYNFISFLCGEICFSIFNFIRSKIYKRTDSNV